MSTMSVDEYTAQYTEFYALFIKYAGRVAVTGEEPLWQIFDTVIRKIISVASANPIGYLTVSARVADPFMSKDPVRQVDEYRK